MEMSILFPSDQNETQAADATRLTPFSLYNSATSRGREVWCVVACGADRAIGRQGAIPWRLSEDLKHFRQVTMGHAVIMGRKTWESLPKKPLPGRRNIVVTRNDSYYAPGAETAQSIEAAVAMCSNDELPIIIGGEQVYREALPYCTKAIITLVDVRTPDADAFFPELPERQWQISDESEEMTSANGIGYKYVTFSRR